LMQSAAFLAEDDDSFIARANFNGVSDENKHIIFDSFASLDDNNLDDCFGLDIETVEAAEMYSVPKDLKIQQSSSITHQKRSESNPPSLSFSNSRSINGKESTKPKRPLSAYNLFFQLERERLIAGTENTPITVEDVERVVVARRIADGLPDKPKRKHRKSHGKINFAELARAIANKWKILDPSSKNVLLERAASEKAHFLRELEEWTKQNEIVDSQNEEVNSMSFSGNGEKTYVSVTEAVSNGWNTSLKQDNPVGDGWNAHAVDAVAFGNKSMEPSLSNGHLQNGNMSMEPSLSNGHVQNNEAIAVWQPSCQSLHDERNSLQYAFLQHKDFPYWQRSCQSLQDQSISLQYAFLQHRASFLAHSSHYNHRFDSRY
jgi:hypothetical protein